MPLPLTQQAFQPSLRFRIINSMRREGREELALVENQSEVCNTRITLDRKGIESMRKRGIIPLPYRMVRPLEEGQGLLRQETSSRRLEDWNLRWFIVGQKRERTVKALLTSVFDHPQTSMSESWRQVIFPAYLAVMSLLDEADGGQKGYRTKTRCRISQAMSIILLQPPFRVRNTIEEEGLVSELTILFNSALASSNRRCESVRIDKKRGAKVLRNLIKEYYQIFVQRPFPFYPISLQVFMSLWIKKHARVAYVVMRIGIECPRIGAAMEAINPFDSAILALSLGSGANEEKKVVGKGEQLFERCRSGQISLVDLKSVDLADDENERTRTMEINSFLANSSCSW